MDHGLVLGRARIGLFAGVAVTAVGLTMHLSALAWLGVAVLALSVLANVVAKVSHFREVPLTPERRTRLAATWLFLAVALIGLVAAAVARQTGGTDAGVFWPLVVVVAVLGAVYRYFRSRYLGEEMAESSG